MFDRVRTLAIYVSDLERARKFYVDVLEFELTVLVNPELCFLRSGEFHVYLKGGNRPVTSSTDTCRLSFFLETEQSVFDVFERLKARGVKMLHAEPEEVGDDIYCFQFEDPDGNILEASGKS
jgi:catechol 2,3-dioxygenase-like lactoylglutathione lyase family enzyme